MPTSRPSFLSMKSFAAVAAVSLLLLAPFARADGTALKKFSLGDWEREIGYCQAVRTGNTLYISGTVGRGEMPGAIKEAFEVLDKTLKAYDLSFKDVVKETIYTTDIEALKTHRDVRLPFYAGNFPAATWVEVRRLWAPEDVIEVELIAVFPE